MKSQSVVYIGEITGDYEFQPSATDPFYHWRSVQWIGEAIPRTNFGQDLLYTFGAFLTIFRVQRNNAEARIQTMRKNGWKAETVVPAGPTASMESGSAERTDLEPLAQDQIAALIVARFKGHGLSGL